MHVVLVDNGRSERLGMEDFWYSLKCIRCGACMNTCPVYRRSGGHSYGATVPGPIGSILNPARDPEKYATLPYACSLCASCTDVCPVKINLHELLLENRHEAVVGKLLQAATIVVDDRARRHSVHELGPVETGELQRMRHGGSSRGGTQGRSGAGCSRARAACTAP